MERFTHILLFRALYLVRTGLSLAYDDKKGLENDDKKGLENDDKKGLENDDKK